MELIEEFTDDRQKSWCIHCGATIALLEKNWDHVPTKSLLDRPLPAHTPQVQVCKPCNRSFSLDEEYFSTFLSCVLSGSTEPQAQAKEATQRALARNPSLVARLNASRSAFTNIEGEDKVIWQPEIERIHRIVIKNARGHAFFEFGEPMLDEPELVWAVPLTSLNSSERADFENVSNEGWPEVGSRMMERQLSGADLDSGWIVVQDDVYRFAVLQQGTMLVRSVIRNYLATEVLWN